MHLWNFIPIISTLVKFTLNWTHVYVYIQLRVNLTWFEIILYMNMLIYFFSLGLLFFPLLKSYPHAVETFQGGRKSQPFSVRIYILPYARGAKQKEGKAHL